MCVTVLEAGKSEVKELADSVLNETPFSCFIGGTSALCLHMVEWELEISILRFIFCITKTGLQSKRKNEKNIERVRER